MAEAGYQIGKRFFPFPSAFRLLDPVLIRDLTGMTWEEFVTAMPDEDDPDAIGDPIVMLGMLGVAIWQANPSWKRERVTKYVQGIKIEDVEAVGIDAEENTEDDVVPPALTNGSNPSERTNEQSDSDSDSTSEQSSQKPSGSLRSATTPKP